MKAINERLVDALRLIIDIEGSVYAMDEYTDGEYEVYYEDITEQLDTAIDAIRRAIALI